jgi:hypothetical protein
VPIINNDEAKDIPFREGYRLHITKERSSQPQEQNKAF